MTSNATRLSMSFGHGTVEVLETPFGAHPALGAIVQDGPHGMKWQRREVYSVSWSSHGQGYVASFYRGGEGFYPEQNIRNLEVLAASRAEYEARGQA